ncbi:MAG: MBL fold metallo-hydrolase [Lachnospiraceae bacterium]|nr:MBL fold metallo-hydrolase [Lachnospiraceae bacterium]
MIVTKDIKYAGVNDLDIKLFEGQYEVPEGMAYNSYLISDEKIAVMDSVDGSFAQQWLENVENELQDRLPDYLIVHHMEPDHSGGIRLFMDKYKDAQIVASKPAFNMMKNYFGTDYPDRQIVVTEGSEMKLGSHMLKFISAPMVHWPEVMMSYEVKEKVLFSADAFGKFGINKENSDEDWEGEARRYYFGIVGKFGRQVQAVLKKAADLDISIICSLHGPVLRDKIDHYIDLYDKWSSYSPEEAGVTIAYTSVYGNTGSAVYELRDLLKSKGIDKIEVFDLASDDMSEAVEAAFRYDRIVLATTTYNGDIFPFMKTFIEHLKDHNYCKRKVALIENGTWAPVANKKMSEYLEGMNELSFCETKVRIMGSLNESVREQLISLADELCVSIL